MNIIIVGAGLFGTTCARLLQDKGHTVQIVEQRPHIGGNCYDVEQNGIMVHKHGPHIFHTNNEEVWEFLNRFTKFNNYVHKCKCSVNGKLIQFPPNQTTLEQLGSKEAIIEKLFVPFTQKAWGTQHTSVWDRFQPREDRDEQYFLDEYQGIPVGGYTKMIQRMLKDIPVVHRRFTVEDITEKDGVVDQWICADKIIYSGSIDELFKYKYGTLPYMSRRFEEDGYKGWFQDIAVINYPDADHLVLRTIDHQHFYPENYTEERKITIFTREFPAKYDGTNERYYPIETPENRALYEKYLELLPQDVIVGGRLGSYRYMDMDTTIEQAFNICNNL